MIVEFHKTDNPFVTLTRAGSSASYSREEAALLCDTFVKKKKRSTKKLCRMIRTELRKQTASTVDSLDKLM